MRLSSFLSVALVIAALFAATTRAADKPAFPPATPESQGVPAALLQPIGDEIAGYVKSGMIVGAELLIIKNRKAILHETYGLRDREDKRPMERNTIFNVRSMTKSFTGAAIQILADEGKLRLDEPVAKYLPAFDNDKSRAITIQQLLEHRSGLPLTNVLMVRQFKDLQAQAAATGDKGPQFKPGEKFFYSDAGSDAAAAVVEKVTGMTIDQFVTKRILEPVGLTDSFYPSKADDPRKQRIGCLYIGGPGRWNRMWKPGGEPFYPFAWGSQTLYSTPVDFARFLAMWLDDGKIGEKQLLSPAAMQRILTPAAAMSMLGADLPYPTGFGGVKLFYGQMAMLYVRGDKPDKARTIAFGHGGSDGTMGWAFPGEDLIICFFTQSRGTSTIIRLETTIDRYLLQKNGPQPPVPEALKPFLGTYYANFQHYKNAEFKIVYQYGRLALDIPDQFVFELKEPDKDGKRVFALTDKAAVSFKTDAAGKVVSMTVHEGGSAIELPRDKPTKPEPPMKK